MVHLTQQYSPSPVCRLFLSFCSIIIGRAFVMSATKANKLWKVPRVRLAWEQASVRFLGVYFAAALGQAAFSLE